MPGGWGASRDVASTTTGRAEGRGESWVLCQSCGARNPAGAESCRRCLNKLLVLSGGFDDDHEALAKSSEETVSFDEHLLERISILEEAVKRLAETVRQSLGALRKHEESLQLAEAGVAAVRDVLADRGLLDPEDWSRIWDQHRRQRLIALDQRERFHRAKDRMLAIADRSDDQVTALLAEAEEALADFDLELAVERLEAAFARDPGNDEIAAWLGETYLAAGEAERALEHFDRLLQLKPDHYAALVYGGVLCEQAGRSEAAEERLQEAVRRYPNAFLPAYSLATVYADRGRLEEAETMAERALAIHREPRALTLRGQLLLDLGRPGMAIEALAEAVEAAPRSEEAHHLLGLAYLARGWRKRALGAFRAAQRINPDRLRYEDLIDYLSGRSAVSLPRVRGQAARWVERGQRALRAQRWARAASWFARALEREPDHPTVLVHHALTCLELGRTDEAERAARKLLEQRPSGLLEATSLVILIRSLRAAGREDEGETTARELWRRRGSSAAHAIAGYELASLLAERDDALGDAEGIAREALATAPEELRAFPLAALGWIKYRQGRFAEAVELLGRAVDLTRSTTHMRQLGMALLAAGREQRAREVLLAAQDSGVRGDLSAQMLEHLRSHADLVASAVGHGPSAAEPPGE